MVALGVVTFCILFSAYAAVIINYDSDTKERTHTPEFHQKVLLISLDGLRWDFISKHKQLFPNIISLVENGVSVSHVENVFPTNTFPNHYSTVTGLYPESHGIIDNQMFDEATGEKFSMKTTDPKWWNEAEPIWVTNQKQGHKSGVSNWPGFNVRIGGMLPTFSDSGSSGTVNSNSILPSNDKIDAALHWLQTPGVTFAAVYFEEPDVLKHEIGDQTINHRIEAMSQLLDNVFGHLKSQLQVLDLVKKVNVLVIGDHGYVGVNNNRIIRLKDFIDLYKDIQTATGRTFISVFPKPGKLSTVYEKLKHAHPKMKVYLKRNLPNYMHIKNNKRTAPLLLLPNPGWLIDTGRDDHPVFKLQYFNRGEHGYSNLVKDMHPDFFAFGPCFKKGEKFDKIRMVDVYPLMCAIMDIKPRPNNGSLNNMNKLLSDQFLKKLEQTR